MATSAMPKPVSPMTKLATKTTRAPAAQARVTPAIITDATRAPRPARWRPSCNSPPVNGGAAMLTLGYKLSSEEFALNSDHFHPWTDAQGQSPLVWSVIGALAHTTSRLVVGTGVTCPTMRVHPTLVAQAAATSAAMMPGRFFLGVGTGENINEHI